MKSKIVALLLFSLTAATVAFYPMLQSNGSPQPTPVPQTKATPKVEVVFALDTTSSMSGLIQAAKEKIWSIASNMAHAQPAPEIKIGLVAFRDRGDDYVTHVIDLSSDLDQMYATLMDFRAEGGGDGPESVNQALYDAVNKISWSQDGKTYKVIFLVGDAPPHMDYQDDVKFPQSVAAASAKGIVVNTIQCGTESETQASWNQIAQLGQGKYFQVDTNGNAVAIHTPFDARLAELSSKLDDTRLYWGDEEHKAEMKLKMDASAKMREGASVASQARRATYNTSKSGEINLLGRNELVDDVAKGRIELSNVKKAELPKPLQAMPAPARKKYLEDLSNRREALKKEIQAVAEQRDAFMKKKIAEQGGAKDSLDAKLYGAVRDQAAEKGIEYAAEPVSY